MMVLGENVGIVVDGGFFYFKKFYPKFVSKVPVSTMELISYSTREKIGVNFCLPFIY
jgi:hypothetical protein